MKKIFAPGQANHCCACLVSGIRIGVPRAEIAAADFLEPAARGQFMFVKQAGESDVVTRVFGARIAARHAGDYLPIDQVGGFSEAGLIAGAIKADVEHVKRALMEKDKRIIDRIAVESAGIGRRRENELAVLVRSAERSDLLVAELLREKIRAREKT